MIREKHKKVVYFGIREESWNVRVLIHPQPPTEYAKTGSTFGVRGDAYRIPHIFVSIRARIRQKCRSRGSNTDVNTWECAKVFESLENASFKGDQNEPLETINRPYAFRTFRRIQEYEN